jgi:2-polyprenyl-3-methyl-5-hydroxy-6-metoxy-1,4-benzoquinol methylase
MPEARRFHVDGRLVDEAECRRLFAAVQLPDRMRRAAALVEGETVADIGAYYGGFVDHLTSAGHRAIGIDYDPHNIEIAEMLFPELEFVESSVYELALPDASVDCVTFQEVIEHLEGPAQALKEINRILRPGGVLIVTTPNAYYWRHFRDFAGAEAKDRLRRRPPTLANAVFHAESEWNRHIHAWTPSTLLTLVEGNGFRYVSHEFALDAVSGLERALLQVAPFTGPVIVLKVRKTAEAPARLV